MEIKVKAKYLQAGMMCEVVGPDAKAPVLAKITKVIDEGEQIAAEITTKVGIRLMHNAPRLNYLTVYAQPDDVVAVSHLPSAMGGDSMASHGRQQQSTQAEAR